MSSTDRTLVQSFIDIAQYILSAIFLSGSSAMAATANAVGSYKFWAWLLPGWGPIAMKTEDFEGRSACHL